jgi:hypothetical protein
MTIEQFDSTLLGKPIDQLTPAELASLASGLAAMTAQLTARQTEIKKVGETDAFKLIADVAVTEMRKLSWDKMPNLYMAANAAGDGYTVQYVKKSKAQKSATAADGTVTVKRTEQGINGGDITINKIIKAKGELAFYQDTTGAEFENIKDIVKALKQPDKDGKPTNLSEADRCWDISKKGISASDILTRYHSDTVLVFKDGSQLTVKDAVAELKAAREVAAPAAPVTPPAVA